MTAIADTTSPISNPVFSGAWLNVMTTESESNPDWTADQSFPASKRAATSRLSLLLAEDNLADTYLVREAIRAENLPLDVQVASDGERAMSFIEQAEAASEDQRPDIVLLDLNLPKRDGFEILQRLRSSATLRSLPVVIFTSSDSPEDRRRAAELGATYFRKPASYEEFLKLGGILKDVLRERGLI